ncbi:MAG: FAD:protein FMN transferase [Bacteroidales bacterium]|nr:FAD:protein FMN transferase [Bacteroidales bacterium]
MHEPITSQSVRHFGSGRFFATLAAMVFFVSCSQDDKVTLRGETQGSYYSIAYYDHQNRNMQSNVNSIFDEVDRTFSLWNDSSLLRRVNEGLTDSVSPLFAYVTNLSLCMNAYTNGAFDCRVGRLVRAWGFSFKSREDLAQQAIDSLLTYARGNVSIADSGDSYRLLRQYPETELDFNAIAQGVTSDMIKAMFIEHGIESYMADVGGEVITGAPKPDGSPWLVGIERPAANRYAEREVQLVIGVSNLAVVTSGSYRKYYEKDGVKYSHTINPTTGRPVDHTLLSATVVSDHAWRADALATAFMVMGLDSALAFIAHHPDDSNVQRALFIYTDSDGNYQTYATPQFQELIIEE